MTRTKKPRKRRTKRPQKKDPYPGRTPDNSRWAKGNQIWKVRSSHGRKPIFQTAEALYEACIQYFEWEDANPWDHEQLAGSYHGDPIKTTMYRKVPYTIGGLCLFLDISHNCWTQYRERTNYIRVCQYIEDIIRRQKFQGAAAGYFNHAIIARDLGLVDKKDLTSGGQSITPSKEITVKMSPREAEKIYKDFIKKEGK